MAAGRLVSEFSTDFWDVLPGKLLASVEGYAAIFRVPVSKYFWLFPPHAMPVKELQAMQDGPTLFPSTHHLLGGVLVAVVLSVLRYLLNIFVFVPLGKLVMRLKVPTVKFDHKLEKAYRENALLGADANQRAKELGVDAKTLSRYFRVRRQEAFVGKKLFKFSEAAWRDLIYLAAVVCAVAYIVPQAWFKDITECWRRYPAQAVPTEVYFFYAFELGIYLHLSIYQFFDTRRSDFWEMFVHHMATTTLIVLSWLSGFVRVGTLVMMIHDISDVFLETAKLFNYASQARPWAQVVTDGCFVMFALTFFITRLTVFPFWICWSTFTDAHRLIPPQDYPGMHIFYGLLAILQCLHVFWFYLIARMAFKMIVMGKVEKDVRSDDEDEPMGEDDDDFEDDDSYDKKKVQ